MILYGISYSSDLYDISYSSGKNSYSFYTIKISARRYTLVCGFFIIVIVCRMTILSLIYIHIRSETFCLENLSSIGEQFLRSDYSSCRVELTKEKRFLTVITYNILKVRNRRIRRTIPSAILE